MAKHDTADKPSVLIRLVSPSLVVAVFTDDSPAPAEWQVYLDAMRKLNPGYRMAIFSAGGGPNTMQRGDLEKLTEGLGPDSPKERVAVITVSRLARGIVTAIRWFNREIKAFEPGDREAAFEFLELSKEERTNVLRLAKAMAGELGVSDRLLLAG